MGRIFADLYDEIGRVCLLRVPLIYHGILRQVCKSWRAVVESPLFYEERKQLKLCDEVIFVLRKTLNYEADYIYEMCLYDPKEDAWRMMGGIHSGNPTIHTINQRLISIHGKRVMTYDFPSNCWLKVY